MEYFFLSSLTKYFPSLACHILFYVVFTQSKATTRNENIARKDKRAQKREAKALDPKGFITDEEKWLLSEGFLTAEKPCSDGNVRDADGRHYLGKMDTECMYCGALGFGSEAQHTATNPEDRDGKKLAHFASLY